MPTVPINAEGVVLYYEDSGPPAGSSDYVTLVVIHGFIFHGAGFLGLFPRAASYNLRLLAVNLRDYPGSTPYSPSELAFLCSEHVADQAAAVRSQGREIAAFLKYIIETEHLPPVGDRGGEKTGGIAVMSWSMGNVWATSLFGNTSSLDEATGRTLSTALHTWILYDPPHYPAGIPLPEEIYYPNRDESIPLDERAAVFRRWVSGFYTPLDEVTDDVQVLGGRQNVYDVTGEEAYRPTTDALTAAELESITTPDVLLRSGRVIFTTKDKVWWDNAQNALCDIDSTFSHVKALLIWCDMAPTPSPFAVKNIMDRIRGAAVQGKLAREVKLLKIGRANHFFHWHEPDRFLQTLADNI